MSVWEEIVNSALIGTERQQFTMPMQSAKLDELLVQMQSESRELTLLSAAAATALYQRAGRLPQKAKQALSEPCIEDDLPRCNARAAQHLLLMLSGEHKEVLPEWLAALAQAGKRVPEESLPKLLDLGKAQEHLCDAIIAVIGKRGQWLAAQNPEWDYVVGTLDESLWETGGFEMRLALLKKLRASDPTRARELVASTWSADASDARAAFIAAFQIGLTLDDEVFLEAALDDRRKEVRRTAADLLARLPESALVKRMIERVQPLISFKSKMLGKGSIEITLPVACDKTMQRDGIELKIPAYTAIGEKAWWLKQMIGAVPASIWSESMGKAPEEILAVIEKSHYRDLLMEGWVKAVERYPDDDWIEALIRELMRKPNPIYLPPLFGLLSNKRREAFALHALQSEKSVKSGTLTMWAMTNCKYQWSTDLSKAFFTTLLKQVQAKQLNDSWWFGDFDEVARYVNVTAAADFMTLLSEASGADHQTAYILDRFLTTLQFRYEMLMEIKQ